MELGVRQMSMNGGVSLVCHPRARERANKNGMCLIILVFVLRREKEARSKCWLTFSSGLIE